jgi:hypothetical protein
MPKESTKTCIRGKKNNFRIELPSKEEEKGGKYQEEIRDCIFTIQFF